MPPHRRRAPLVLLTTLTAPLAAPLTTAACTARQAPPDMVWIAGGEFAMCSDDPSSRRNEQPVHRVQVGGFWIDARAVSHDQFARFVAATGHVTTAEQQPSWEELRQQLPPGTPKP